MDIEYDNVLKAIDSIHGDGPLPSMELLFKPTTGTANGEYSLLTGNINIFKIGKVPLTLAHEIGHWLDHKGFDGLMKKKATTGIKSFASHSDMFSDFVRVAKKSRKIQEIESSPGLHADSIDYLTSNHEMFARAYAQYIAKKSGNPKMIQELKYRQGSPTVGSRYPDQWDDDDFEPIAKEIENIFLWIGWQKIK